MTDTENLVLEQLRAIRNEIAELRSESRENFSAMGQRLTSMELNMAGMRKDFANIYGDVVSQSHRYDRLLERIERVERRLELNEGQL